MELWWLLEEPFEKIKKRRNSLGSLATDAAGQLNVLGHDGNPLGVDGAQVSVLEESHQVSLTGLLKSHHSRALEPQVGLEVLGDLTDEALEGKLADEQFCGLLVAPDLTESHGTGLVAVRLLDASGGGSALAGGFGGQLLPWGLASSGFAGGLLGTSHIFDETTVNELLRAKVRKRCSSLFFYNLPPPP